ncbi:MAG: signal peptidase I [Dehalococcoidales bacterium]|nr:signal peptidase I [Dehalococcoidales bacterium]
MKKIAEYTGCIVVVLIMTAAVLTYLGPHLGWRVDAVLSGSMEPELSVGSLVITRFVEPETIVTGDIITFYSDSAEEKLITHRVVGVGQSSSLYFETKGDANEDTDPFTVPVRNLVGKVIFQIDYIGYFTKFLKTPIGFLLTVVIPGAIIIALYIITIWQTISRNKKHQSDAEISE